MILRWLYTRSIVIDGNFSSEHLKMKRPEEDVFLSPGGRYMVEPKRYELHLKTGREFNQVCAEVSMLLCFLTLTKQYAEISML